VLRKNGRPLLVEKLFVELTINHGAENYPENCMGKECWIELSYQDIEWLEKEMEWIYGW
jgi:hypothetical protein